MQREIWGTWVFWGDEIEDFLGEGNQIYLGAFMGSLGDFWRCWGSCFGCWVLLGSVRELILCCFGNV